MECKLDSYAFYADAHESDRSTGVRSQRLSVFGPYKSRRWVPSIAKLIIQKFTYSKNDSEFELLL